MNDISALNSAMQGIQQGLTGMRKNALDVAKVGASESSGPADYVKPLVDLKQNELQVMASAKVLNSVDEAIGSLFDDKA